MSGPFASYGWGCMRPTEDVDKEKQQRELEQDCKEHQGTDWSLQGTP